MDANNWIATSLATDLIQNRIAIIISYRNFKCPKNKIAGSRFIYVGFLYIVLYFAICFTFVNLDSFT